jgi:PAS domain S-box-containing protein
MSDKILVVDDDERVLRTFARNLALTGCTVLTASEGREALRLYAKEQPDVTLLDVRMPGMNGFELLDVLRTRDPDAEVILVTGHGDMETAIEALRAGASDFIPKPVDQETLDTALRRAQERLRLKRELAGAREALRASEEHYRAITETAFVGVGITDAGEDMLFVNQAFAEMLGYQRHELIGINLSRLTSPEEYAYYQEQTQRRQAGYRSQYETTLYCKDGTELNALVSASPLWKANGHFQGTLAVLTDITERKTAETALRRYAEEQAALYSVTSSVATTLSPGTLLATVLDVLLPLLDADAGWVILPGPTLDDPPQVAAWRGLPDYFIRAEEQQPLRTCPVCVPLLQGEKVNLEPALITACPRLPPEVVEQIDLHSHVGIPLTAAGTVMGVLHVGWRSVYSPFETRHSLLLAIGRQVGLALYNARLYQSARQVDRLQVINQLDRSLSATLNPERVHEITLQQMAAGLDAGEGILFVLPSAIGPCSLQVYTLHGEWTEKALTQEDAECLWACLDPLAGEFQRISLSGDDLLAICSTGHEGVAQRWGPHSLIIPIEGSDGPLAMIVLGGRSVDRPFTEEDRALARAAAARAEQAIRNARLYHASQERAARLATLNAISAASVSSLELDVVLRQVLELTCQALDAAEGNVLTLEPETGSLVVALTRGGDLRGLRLAPGQSIAGWVAQHGQATYVNDVQRDSRWEDGLERPDGLEVHSICCAPLQHMGKITGAIEILNKRGGQFTEEDLNLLESVSSIASAALENARLFTTTRARAEELALLHEIGLVLTATLDSSTVIEDALAQIQRLFQAEGVSLLQVNPQTGRLFFVRALQEIQPVEITLELEPGEGLAGWVLEQRRSVLVRDAQGDTRYSGRVDRELDYCRRSVMAAPLLTPSRAIGVIEVVSDQEGIYTAGDLRVLEAVASNLTVALENARLYEELRGLLREREQAQAQLIHSEKMAALGRLVASLAHEINNPLQSVQGCLTLVGEELNDGQRKDRLERYLGIAEAEIERISAIVRRMRDFYRPPRPEWVLTDVHAILSGVLTLANKQLEHSDIEVTCDRSAELPEIQANPDHLKQVFLNLVLNAMDAMPRGGRLHVSTGVDEMGEQTDQAGVPAVRIEFHDSGEGIPPDALPHIFEPFFTTKEQGSGLGLSVSYGIVKAHNGDILVTSQVGEGTTFTVLLPVEQ